MTGCRLLIAAMLALAGILAAQATADLGWATTASQTEGPGPSGPDAVAQPTVSPDAAAADLYSANADLLAHQLADGVQAGILVPYCQGLAAANSEPRPAACTTLGPRTAP